MNLKKNTHTMQQQHSLRFDYQYQREVPRSWFAMVKYDIYLIAPVFDEDLRNWGAPTPEEREVHTRASWPDTEPSATQEGLITKREGC
jgi:hypothetical protein